MEGWSGHSKRRLMSSRAFIQGSGLLLTTFCQLYCALSAVCFLDFSSCDEHGEQQCKIIPIAIRSEAGMPDVQVSLVHTRALKAPPFKLKSIRIHKEQKPKNMKLYPQKAIKASAS
jgi:hypothetical protein